MSACSHEHHHALHDVHGHHNVETRLAEAEVLCATTGARLTPLRKEVLALILNATGPMGAYDLLAKIKSNADRPADGVPHLRLFIRKRPHSPTHLD